MISIEKVLIHNIPVLHIAKQSDFSKKMPLVIFVHGFTSRKEKNLHYAYLLAEKGLRVVLPEALLHGERSENISEKDLNFHFWEIVLNTIEEIPLIKDYFEEKGTIDSGRIGLAGTSMGGIVTLGALSQYDWIHTAVVLMGSPSYEEFAKWQLQNIQKYGIDLKVSQDEIDSLLEKVRQYDLTLQPEKMRNRPILFWHGKKDQAVPFKYSFEFYERIKKDYDPDHLMFILDENAGHKVSKEGIDNSVLWFEKHLTRYNSYSVN
ncbi:putative hydrolase [Bacillus methanolicus PB1]|uniref:Putative hydrolase n=1 Tax=Bacillus methanolicus PB1 TaxID=997296 RepID=I3E5W0_BACMT|nr:prolyl oligopeptidase family serine peptidase [Bacillus methanolicus]EIJ81881.1 putative hydrolase [Bacillus methanolicus PB1]